MDTSEERRPYLFVRREEDGRYLPWIVQIPLGRGEAVSLRYRVEAERIGAEVVAEYVFAEQIPIGVEARVAIQIQRLDPKMVDGTLQHALEKILEEHKLLLYNRHI